MAKQTLTDFTLTTDSYASFDAVSLKSLMKERLNQTSFFTDQNYEGSNLSSMIDIIAYSYHVLIFYLNQTSTESLFSEAELYENMNRIVKSLDYKPVGPQTCNLAFSVAASNALLKGTYTIPRYSFVESGGSSFSFTEDISFTKIKDATETLTDVANQHLLHQGTFKQYPLQSAVGEEFETFIMILGGDVNVDHFHIDVYINDANTGKWEQWTKTSSLYLDGPTDKMYETRYNENKRYEIKFGDNITGKRLNANDTVAIYYINSDGAAGELGKGGIDGSTLIRLATVQFTGIFDDVKDINVDYTTDEQLSTLTFTNVNASSKFYTGETVEDIRQRAPNTFSSQHRLVTKSDYENYIKQAFSNILLDVKVVNNWDYLDGHMKYLTETVGLEAANTDPNTLYNQVTFADSCDFNNIYVYAIPRLEAPTSTVIRNNYLGPGQKNAIINKIRSVKTLTTETIVMDPVYIAVDIGVVPNNETVSEQLKDNTKLQIIREINSSRSFNSIKNNAYSIIKDYFSMFTLGQNINLTSLNTDILNINGVKSVNTVHTDTNKTLEGISLLVWNPVYPHEDITTTTSDVTLDYFKCAYLNDVLGFLDKIEVVSEPTSTGSVEF